jgi:hypothetical protein
MKVFNDEVDASTVYADLVSRDPVEVVEFLIGHEPFYEYSSRSTKR